MECDLFEIKIINNKVKVYYYDEIKGFSSNKITIVKKDNTYTIVGKNMVIETMFKEQIVISGEINNIILRTNDE